MIITEFNVEVYIHKSFIHQFLYIPNNSGIKKIKRMHYGLDANMRESQKIKGGGRIKALPP